jgi:hypothetical protein
MPVLIYIYLVCHSLLLSCFINGLADNALWSFTKKEKLTKGGVRDDRHDDDAVLTEEFLSY